MCQFNSGCPGIEVESGFFPCTDETGCVSGVFSYTPNVMNAMKSTKDMTSYEIGFALDDLGITDGDFPNTDQVISVMRLQDAIECFELDLDVLEVIKCNPDYTLGGYFGRLEVQTGIIWFMNLDLQEINENPGCSVMFSLEHKDGTVDRRYR